MAINKLLLVLFLPFFFQSCITLKDTVVDEDEFLGQDVNLLSIYSQKPDNNIINPFNINTDNWGVGVIDRLMLVEFDPLNGYNSVELQIIKKGDISGALVILYFEDGVQADVYYTPGLSLSREMYENVLNKTVLTEQPIDYRFDEIDGKLIAHLECTDRFDNNIKVNINEKYADMPPVGLLAPIGGKAENPEFMTIVFMKHFKFLSEREDSIKVNINGKEAELATLPVKVNGISGYQTKYSMEPVTVSWNKNYKGPAKLIKFNGWNYTDSNYILTINDNNGYKEISSFTGIQENHKIVFRFSPAIPQLTKLADGTEIEGLFTMGIDNTPGIMAGEYFIAQSGDNTIFQIQATEGYSPVPGTAWMKELIWKAVITNNSGKYILKTEWEKD